MRTLDKINKVIGKLEQIKSQMKKILFSYSSWKHWKEKEKRIEMGIDKNTLFVRLKRVWNMKTLMWLNKILNIKKTDVTKTDIEYKETNMTKKINKKLICRNW